MTVAQRLAQHTQQLELKQWTPENVDERRVAITNPNQLLSTSDIYSVKKNDYCTYTVTLPYFPSLVKKKKKTERKTVQVVCKTLLYLHGFA